MKTATTASSYEESHARLLYDERMQHAIAKVRKLVFSMLKRKLIEEQGWTQEYCHEIEDLYRKFLALNVRYPDVKVCPTGPIDDFWHAHIVDTMAYQKDCEQLFGHILHHFPYFGMRGVEDIADLEAAFDRSLDLFILHFGIDPTAGDTQARSCSPQKCP